VCEGDIMSKFKTLATIVVGEKDNNGYRTEFFRVEKRCPIIIEPQLGTYIRVGGDLFHIEVVVQDPMRDEIYLYETRWMNRYEYNGETTNYIELLKKYLNAGGWSICHKERHKIRLSDKKVTIW
jgi:hypothetical protein